MRLVKIVGLTALVAMAAMAFVGATPVSAATSTQLCTAHTGLTCSSAATTVHQALQAGTVGKLLSTMVDVLCLGVLVEATALDLGNPQLVHATTQEFTGCGTGSSHSNCTVTVEEQALLNLLKTGLDEGVLTATSGKIVLQCPNLGLNCLFDLEGAEFSVGAGHFTAEGAPTFKLDGKLFCPDEVLLDWLQGTLTNTYVLG